MLMLRLSGAANIAIALMHVIGLLWAEQFFRWAGASEMMAELRQTHFLLPYVITLGAAGVFAVFGLYAFSATGDIPRLPLMKLALTGIAVVYILRGVGGFLEVGAGGWDLIFAACALLIGLGYAFGAWMLIRNRPMVMYRH